MKNITGKTKIFGVVGYPIKHTLSPVIHNRLFKEFSMDSVYIAFEVIPDKFDKFFHGLKSINNFTGLNITVPFKNRARKYLDIPSEFPVNTAYFKNGKVSGYNTDIYGFKKALQKNFPDFKLKDKNVLLLGAGGAAQGVGISLIQSKIKKLVIANRTYQKAEKLKKYLNKFTKNIEIRVEPLDYDIISKSDETFHLIINATSVGLKNEKSLLDFKSIREKNTIVYDLIYNPEFTDFLLKARKKGLRVINGIDMLIFQAFRAFQIWTGKNPEKFYYKIKKEIMEYMH